MMPKLEDMSIFGGKKSMSAGNDFEGTFYSLAYARDGRRSGESEDTYKDVIHRFVESGWNPYTFISYFRGSQKLYTSQIFIPTVFSEFGPSHFGVPSGPDFDPYIWCVHYKGKIMRKEGGRFRFWGLGDDVLLVRVNGELVANLSWERYVDDLAYWEPYISEDRQYHIGHSYCAVGNWF